jgi:hypothetical protein
LAANNPAKTRTPCQKNVQIIPEPLLTMCGCNEQPVAFRHDKGYNTALQAIVKQALICHEGT